MRPNSFLTWLRWIAVLPATAITYLAVSVGMLVIGVNFLKGQIIDDPLETYEVSSHLLWDWFLYPVALVVVGASSASIALRCCAAIAPAWKATTTHIVAGMLICYCLINVLFAVVAYHNTRGSLTVALFVNASAAVGGIVFAALFKPLNIAPTAAGPAA